jgi:putative flippase GtrA
MLDGGMVDLCAPSVRAFGRFVVVGTLNSAAGYGLFAALVLVGLVPEAALLVATIVGVVFNFATTGHFVFANCDPRLILRFVAVYATIYVMNALALRYLTYVGISPLFAQLWLVPTAAIATFLAFRRFVFKEKSS